MGELRKIRISSIDGPFRDRFSEGVKHNISFYKKRYLNYDWDGLRKSFDKYGYDTDRFGHIEVVGCSKCEYKDRYDVKDGNHRLHVLRERFGEEHFVVVNLVKSYELFQVIPTCGWCNKVKDLIKTTSGKLELANVIIISTCFLLLYLKPTLIFMGVILGIIIVSVTGVFDIKKETYTKHSHKYGGNIGRLINVVTNIPMITIMLASIYYIWHLISINIYGFMVMVGLTLIMGYLIRYYEKKEENGWKEGDK